ncbi:MAG: alpha/beta hydrolase [bacterium]
MKIVKRILKGIGIVISIVVIYLLFVTFGPGFSVPEQPLKKETQLSEEVKVKPAVSRKDVRFKIKGSSVSAWLYLPENLSTLVPCIIMETGFGGTKDFQIMEAFAIRFQEAGFAVLTFDHRYTGESEGEPRQLIWIPDQLEDLTGAVEFVRGLKEIDPAKIALWGTSLGGGHVMVTAAKDHNIACVVAQCPGLDGSAGGDMFLKREGIGHALRLIVHGQRDMARYRLGLSPHKIPIVGKPGSIAFSTTADAYNFYSKVAPENYINEACARVILRANLYRPVKHARTVRCPVLLQICENDSLVPISAIEETAKILGKYAEVKRYPIGHFDIYFGENFEKSVSAQLEFFKRHLNKMP